MQKIAKLSFSSQVFLALCLGLFIGLFFGEKVAWLDTVGMAFIKFLQIAITPYILLSLVTGLGSLSYAQTSEITKKFGIILLLLWGLGLFTIFAMSLAFPAWESKDFFSSTQISTLPEINYFDLYIPSNPFKSLSDNTVPAIVVFSLFLGLSLVNVNNKEQFLAPARVLLEALNRMTKLTVKSMPIGIFALTAASAGTLQADDFEKLEIYFFVFISTSLILSFWVMPFFISTITPFKYSDIIQDYRSILITAFASGNYFILIPLMTEACNNIFEKYQYRSQSSDNYNEIILPIAYNFPAMGKLLALTFILFAAWFNNEELSVMQQMMLATNGLFSLFASVNISVPFLLDYLHLPSDMYQLYLSGDVLTRRFSALSSAIFLFVFTLATSAYLVGIVQFKVQRILIFLASCCLVITLSIIAVRSVFNAVLVHTQDHSIKLKQMQVDWDAPKKLPEQHNTYNNTQLSTPDAIIQRGILRIGYNPARTPFSFNNSKNQLVGFDVELMNHLASSLDVNLKLVAFNDVKLLYQALQEQHVDMVISGVHISDEYLSEVLYTQPIMNLTTALIVQDYRKKEFSDYAKFTADTHLNLATLDQYPRLNYIKKNFPNIKISKINKPEEFFEADEQRYDAYISSIEEGMTLVMLYPKYAVTYDPNRLHQFPIGYAVHKHNLALQALLNSWLDVQKATGRIDKLYNYWIEGGGAKDKQARWSILENVLKDNN